MVGWTGAIEDDEEKPDPRRKRPALSTGSISTLEETGAGALSHDGVTAAGAGAAIGGARGAAGATGGRTGAGGASGTAVTGGVICMGFGSAVAIGLADGSAVSGAGIPSGISSCTGSTTGADL